MPPKVDKKICGICGKVIFIPGDEYCVLTQYKKDNKLQGEGYYHVSCFRDKYIAKSNVDKMVERTNRLLAKAEGIYG